MVPIASLHDLPIGAGYEERIGRASAKLVRKTTDTIMLTARCDSLQVMIEDLILERDRITRLNGQLISRLSAEVSKTSEPIKPPPWRRLSWTIVIILLVAIALWRIGRHFLPIIWSR